MFVSKITRIAMLLVCLARFCAISPTISLPPVEAFTEKYMVLCVVNKQQLTHARRIINQVDEKAFAYVENVKEVLGKGFANKEIELAEDEEDSKHH